MASLKVNFGRATDLGQVRNANEDSLGSASGKFGELFIVCDGMGGYKGGALASKTSVALVRDHFMKLQELRDPRRELKIALRNAHQALVRKARESDDYKEMGSTAVVLLLNHGEAHIAHIGDSRIYQIRKGVITQLTKDHSVVQRMIDANQITRQAAHHHPNKNVITRSLGVESSPEAEIGVSFRIQKRDFYVLCTDGLTGHVNPDEIMEIVTTQPPQAACDSLIRLANDRGGRDNITIEVVQVLNPGADGFLSSLFARLNKN